MAVINIVSACFYLVQLQFTSDSDCANLLQQMTMPNSFETNQAVARFIADVNNFVNDLPDDYKNKDEIIARLGLGRQKSKSLKTEQSFETKNKEHDEDRHEMTKSYEWQRKRADIERMEKRFDFSGWIGDVVRDARSIQWRN